VTALSGWVVVLLGVGASSPPLKVLKISIVKMRFDREFKNKYQAVSQGVRRFGKRSIFINM
jgi:hypothetical protein